jgi:hypothetical protein
MEKDTRNRAIIVNSVVMYFKTRVVIVLRRIIHSSLIILSTNKLSLNLQMMPEYPSKPYIENLLLSSKRRLKYPKKLRIFASILILLYIPPLSLFSMLLFLVVKVQRVSGDFW